MRITLGTEEFQFGMVFKKPKWGVTCKIEFSNEELELIKKRNLWDLQIYTQVHHNMPSDEEIDRSLADVNKHGIYCTFNTLVDAKNFEHHLKETLLPSLKNYLSASEEIATGPETFEL